MAMIRPYENIDPIPDNDPDAVPELWNAGRRQMDGNFDVLDTSLQGALSSLSTQAAQITNLENDSATSVTQALRLDWLYSSKTQVALELFYAFWTLLPGLETVVTDAVGGDDSIDVDSVAGLEVGGTYVVFDDDNQESIVIAEILTSTRIRATGDLTYSYSDAKIRKTSWINNGGSATTIAGGIYYSGVLNLGDEYQDKALIMRRQDNDASLAVYFKDVNHDVWTEVPWGWERDVETGIIDVEYVIPARGVFEFKVVSDGATTINHMAAVDAETGLNGIHNPPATPVIVYPAQGATDIDEQPSLTTCGFVSPTGDQLSGTRFQISTHADFSQDHLIEDATANEGVSWAPDKGVLSVSTLYYVRALHMDVAGGVSAWSSAVSFTTASAFISVNKPTCTTPATGAELGTPDGLTLVSSAFATIGGVDTHANSQWQVASDSAFATILHDSGTDDTNLVSYNVPDSTVERGDTCYWRVRHEGTTGGWSDWSLSTVFSVSIMPPVEDVFATEIYTGITTELTIDSGIDLATEGGLVWLKGRNGFDHMLFDTERGMSYSSALYLHTNGANAQASGVNYIDATTDGYTTLSSVGAVHSSGQSYVSWTFRKAEKFFDIVTYTGNGAANREIAHNLGCAPGLVVIKSLSISGHWNIWHRGAATGDYGLLDESHAFANTGYSDRFGDTAPDDHGFHVGGDGSVNGPGTTYVAYLFAHDLSDSGLIQCGSFTGDGTADGQEISLGWKPQWVMVKDTDQDAGWHMWDASRGITSGTDPYLRADEATGENSNSYIDIDASENGFSRSYTNNGSNYIYIAIREPEA